MILDERLITNTRFTLQISSLTENCYEGHIAFVSVATQYYTEWGTFFFPSVTSDYRGIVVFVFYICSNFINDF